MMKVTFEAGTGLHYEDCVNFMLTADRKVYAEVAVPEDASEDYGYMAMKNAIAEAYAGTEPLEFWYDGQEDKLSSDASADCEVYVESEW